MYVRKLVDMELMCLLLYCVCSVLLHNITFGLLVGHQLQVSMRVVCRGGRVLTPVVNHLLHRSNALRQVIHFRSVTESHEVNGFGLLQVANLARVEVDFQRYWVE